MRVTKLPLPVMIMGGIILLMMLFALSSVLHGSVIVVAAILVWVIVIGALFYSAGFLKFIDQLPSLRSLVGFFSLPQEQRATEKPVAAFNREEAIENALKKIRNLLGEHPAVHVILKEIVPAAQQCLEQKKRLLGVEDAWVAIIYGPAGVGKSTIAESLADLLFAYEAVEKPGRTTIDAPISGPNTDDWLNRLQQGLDGVVIVNNAKWLAEGNEQGKTFSNAELFLKTISSVAERYPGRLAIIISLTTEQYNKAFLGSKAVTEYLLRMTTIRLVCESISRELLYDLFVKTLNNKYGISSDPQLKLTTLSIIKTAMNKGELFDYAQAMERWAGRINNKMMSEKGPRVADARIISYLRDETEANNF